MTLEFTITEQARCAAQFNNPALTKSEREGAWMGLCDWLVEEVLMTQEMKVFESGAKSTEVKPEYRLIPIEAMEAIAKRLGYGASRHGERNYQKGAGDPVFIKDRQNHAIEHLMHYVAGETTQETHGKTETPMDHLEAAICNLAMLCYLERNKPEEK